MNAPYRLCVWNCIIPSIEQFGSQYFKNGFGAQQRSLWGGMLRLTSPPRRPGIFGVDARELRISGRACSCRQGLLQLMEQANEEKIG